MTQTSEISFQGLQLIREIFLQNFSHPFFNSFCYFFFLICRQKINDKTEIYTKTGQVKSLESPSKIKILKIKKSQRK